MNSDIETLIQVATYAGAANQSNVSAPPAGLPGVTAQEAPSATSDPPHGPADLAVEIRKLLENVVPVQTTMPVAATASKTTEAGSGVANTILRTAGTMTGLGPIMTGLLKLFGSNEPEPLPQLEKFSAPPPVSVEAALTRDGQYSAVRYAQGATPQSVSGSTGATQVPTIQVNIQAMDSQSFLDRQDDIARAVREAMLHSNSLNDVVMEL
jgi:hypothetical protein